MKKNATKSVFYGILQFGSLARRELDRLHLLILEESSTKISVFSLIFVPKRENPTFLKLGKWELKKVKKGDKTVQQPRGTGAKTLFFNNNLLMLKWIFFEEKASKLMKEGAIKGKKRRKTRASRRKKEKTFGPKKE